MYDRLGLKSKTHAKSSHTPNTPPIVSPPMPFLTEAVWHNKNARQTTLKTTRFF